MPLGERMWNAKQEGCIHGYTPAFFSAILAEPGSPHWPERSIVPYAVVETAQVNSTGDGGSGSSVGQIDMLFLGVYW
jgi:hypothetical protein